MISISDLRKRFSISTGGIFRRTKRIIDAVDGISFEIDPGELVGYIGPNGAGKSTTIKMLTGLLVPTSGEILVNGRIPWKERIAHVAKIGAVFGQRSTLWWDLPVIESLELLQHIYKIPAAHFSKNLSEFIDLLEMDPFIDNPVRSLSLGQRMRADLAAAMMHNPAILFLDEPTIGLDVVAKERIRQFILHINQKNNTTVLLTTHDLSDVEKICERLMIIDQGKLLFDGGLQELRHRFGGQRELVVDFSQGYDDYGIEGAQIKSQQGLRIHYVFEREAVSASRLIGRLSDRYKIRDLEVREPDIESTIRRIYENNLLSR